MIQVFPLTRYQAAEMGLEYVPICNEFKESLG